MKEIPKEIREYVLKRDKYRCRICGRPATEIHHIYPRYTHIPDHLGVPRTVSNHHPDNLISICHECHIRIHNGTLQISRPELVKQNKELRAVLPFPEDLQSLLERLRRG